MLFKGWGRKLSGNRATLLAHILNQKFVLMEDGFIRSCGLGESPSFSIVKDDIGIYYDANKPSRLEELCNNYDFKNNPELLKISQQALDLIIKYQISKYNNSQNVNTNFFGPKEHNILVIAQTKDDLSLKFGLSNSLDTCDMVDIAIKENPGSKIYIKLHPDVINGKKKSDIKIELLKSKCEIIDQHLNPISLLSCFSKVYTKTSQMGFESLIMGCDCVCFGLPFYSGWGLTDDRVKCNRRNRKLSLLEVFAASYILYPNYYNPYSKKKSNILDTIRTIVRFRDINKSTKNKLFLFGFSTWKRRFMSPFLNQYERNKVHYINPSFTNLSPLDLALKSGLDKNSDVYIWGSKTYSHIQEYCHKHQLKINRVEDGFIRSLGLGSDLTRPYSLIFDDVGIYFDPSKPSKLENILNQYEFDEPIIHEARNLITKIIGNRISKYNQNNKSTYSISTDRNIILVVGQVEDDASIICGGNSMTNLSLLKQVRLENPNSTIIYKPHPDVKVGNRIGKIHKDDLYKLADLYIDNGNIIDLISKVNEVHTITSLVGFEALLQNKIVVTYGIPFYAGWGLTKDKLSCKRRKRILTLDELVAGVLIVYPRYIDPFSHKYCTPEVLVDSLSKQRFINEKFNLYSRYIRFIYVFLIRKLIKIYRRFYGYS